MTRRTFSASPGQGDLFGKSGEGSDAYARNNDPQSSHDAARKVSFSKKESVVLGAMAATGVWMTSLCIARYLDATNPKGDHTGWSVSPRLKPLERKGAIERGGFMVVLNSSGNRAKLTAWRYIRPEKRK